MNFSPTLQFGKAAGVASTKLKVVSALRLQLHIVVQAARQTQNSPISLFQVHQFIFAFLFQVRQLIFVFY